MTKVIPREAKRITYSSEIRALKDRQFSVEQLSIISGSLLGDGGLQTGWTGTSKNYRFAAMHSVKQKEYIDWMHKKLKPFVLSQPWLYKPTLSLRVRTISHPKLTELKSQFYKGRKKILPKNIRDIISDPLALAVWFMDDGNITAKDSGSSGYNINTQSFTQKENKKIVHLLSKIWGIECTINKNKEKCRIYIWHKSSLKFRNIVSEFVLPSMKYKLG